MERETLKSRLGFIMLSAGCAIGIGNVWKFPYLTGQYGGGAFVLIYLIFLVILGIPCMTIEFSMGRASKKSPVKMYQALEKPGAKWHIHGIVCYIANILLMMYYTSVAGWMLQYFLRTALGEFEEKDPKAVAAIFQDMLETPLPLIVSVAVVIVLGCLICSIGLQKGLEKVTKVMMFLLLLIMIVLAVNSLFLKGAGEGLAFYLLPDFNRMKEAGIGNVIVAAMSQAFFTLSIGIGSMEIFGSYIDKERTLPGEAVSVALLDTLVALTSGLIIIPACFAYGVSPSEGAGLIFITLPNIFNNMPLGRLWGSLFFIFMTFAAFSTILTVFENIIACTMELTGWSRKKSSLLLIIGMFVLSLPCVLGFNILSSVRPLGPDSGIMDLEDFIVSRLLLPLGSLVFVLFCTLRRGWGFDNFIREANTGRGLKLPAFLRPYLTYVLPLIILFVFIIGLLPAA